MFIFYVDCILDKLGGISAKLKRAWLCIRFAQVLFLFGIFCLIFLDHSSLCSCKAKTKSTQK